MTFTEQYIIPLVKQITNPRFFNSERGYQGQLIALLDNLIKTENLFPKETIIEQEYQKTMKHHGIVQRPDIIIHIPLEAGLSNSRNENNYFVAALKLNGKAKSATDDFQKLTEMFNYLDYPEGVFINVGTYPTTFLSHYDGSYRERIHELSICLKKYEVKICHSMFKNDVVVIKEDY
jgi:hypothetical protein